MTPGDLISYLPIFLIFLVLTATGTAIYYYRTNKRIKAEKAAERERKAFKRANPSPIYGYPTKHERARVALSKLEATINDI